MRIGRPFWLIGAALMRFQPTQLKSPAYNPQQLFGFGPRHSHHRGKRGSFATRCLISLQGRRWPTKKHPRQ